ncbi:hypothetical protein AUCHE_08_00980 [Austwickia chelonae NBRC 105200]|uniref:ATPase AAA-type core domain-containing protein n=2 Tax=Austwickia TaxID=1184606 RepID=K6UM70_9MICO|nr:hypothetical protein AUCHE_08_00980 [Austwickia chelonae NBRC 105200]
MPSEFTKLDPQFFSLGQDKEYYSALMELPSEAGEAALAALRDIVYKRDIYEQCKDTRVMQVSLTRTVSDASINGQFTRIVQRERKEKPFTLKYVDREGHEISFEGRSHATPPTNIHVLIGRNGSGKTRLIQRMTHTLMAGGESEYGYFESDANDHADAIGNVGYISFSAFDHSPPLTPGLNGVDIPVFNVGLRKNVRASADGQADDAPLSSRSSREPKRLGEIIREEAPLQDAVAIKDYTDILADMAAALYGCKMRSQTRWEQAVETLQSDPLFANVEPLRFIDELAPAAPQEPPRLTSSGERRFEKLSSGHQVVLLTVTALVANLEERSIVFFDEPEGHLHPPLLAALIRAVSELLEKNNAVALIATHSPVVLQEVPSKCVHIVERHGDAGSLRSPMSETFGENVGVLTRDVFGLEVDASGFHRLIREVVTGTGCDYDATIAKFNDQLGSEARALLRAIQPSQREPRLDF